MNAETQALLALDAAQRRTVLRLCEAVADWQRDMIPDAGDRIAMALRGLPPSITERVQPTLRELYRTRRGDSTDRMLRGEGGWALPAYQIAGFGNANAAALFVRLSAPTSGFIASGRDLVSATAAVSTPKLYAFVQKARKVLDSVSATNPRAWWAYAHESVGDDEDEVIVVEPRFRTFSDAERSRGHSRNAPPVAPSPPRRR